MSSPWFQFKQFTVWHDKCGMKVGTDSVILGAWVNATGEIDILDIGTGTGLIALMLAQRTTGNIDAVEIDHEASGQAKENFIKSHWSKRLSVYNQSIQEYASNCSKRYDLIVSNPPFFISEQKAPDKKRAIARHADSLTVAELVSISALLLKPNGRLAVVLPQESRNSFIAEICKHNLWLIRELNLKPYPQKSPFRVLFEVSLTNNNTIEKEELIIREFQGSQYSESFKRLTRDYYLAF